MFNRIAQKNENSEDAALYIESFPHNEPLSNAPLFDLPDRHTIECD